MSYLVLHLCHSWKNTFSLSETCQTMLQLHLLILFNQYNTGSMNNDLVGGWTSGTFFCSHSKGRQMSSGLGTCTGHQVSVILNIIYIICDVDQ